jgi:hypothetical protein
MEHFSTDIPSHWNKLKRKRIENDDNKTRRAEQVRDPGEAMRNIAYEKHLKDAILPCVQQSDELFQLVITFLPSITAMAFRSYWKSGRWKIVLHHDPISTEDRFPTHADYDRWNLQIANVLIPRADNDFCVFFNCNPSRTIVLQDGGPPTASLQTCSIADDDDRIISNPQLLTLRLVITSVLKLPGSITKISIEELGDVVFAGQIIQIIGCHGCNKYPLYYRYCHNGIITTLTDYTSKIPYLKRHWDDRKASYHTLTHDCDNCWPVVYPYLHHFCRKTDNKKCDFLEECHCECKTCSSSSLKRPSPWSEVPHVCDTPEKRLCFAQRPTMPPGVSFGI